MLSPNWHKYRGEGRGGPFFITGHWPKYYAPSDSFAFALDGAGTGKEVANSFQVAHTPRARAGEIPHLCLQ